MSNQNEHIFYLEELVYEQPDAHNAGIVAEVDLWRLLVAPLDHKREQRVRPVAQAHR